MNNDDKDCIKALLVSLLFSIVVVFIVCVIAREANAADMPRWAVVKWQRGIPVMATFEPTNEKDCKGLADERNKVYAHAGMHERWTCEDLATLGDKGA